MPATLRKAPTSVTGGSLPPKKRQRQSPPSGSQTSLSRGSAQPPPPAAAPSSPTPAPAAPAPVLSAVAARRAARLASSASSSSAPQPRENVQVKSPSPPPPQPRDESDSSDSASDVEAALLNRTQPGKGKGKGKKKDAVKRKKETPSRYFSGAQEDDATTEQAAQDNEGTMDERSSRPVARRAVRPRRRREKTAFVDPECYSNFRVQESVNAWSSQVDREDGSTCEGVIYGLRIGEDLVVHGTFDLTILSGSVTLLGSTVTSNPTAETITVPKLATSTSHRVFSPASQPIPPISALPHDSDESRPTTLSLYLGAHIDISRFSALVLVTPTQTGVEGIESALKSGGLGCANGMFPAPSAPRSNLGSGSSWILVTEAAPGLTILRQVEHWSAALETIVPATNSIEEAAVDPGRLTVVVEGPKRVGKSTFAKTLLNKLLDRYEAVAYLDTDLGQPEFSTPGFVSLNVLRKPVFGPAFTHLSLPVASHFLGSTSPASDPESYTAAVASLLATYALEVEFPLVDEPAPAHPRRRHHHEGHHRANVSSQSVKRGGGGKIRERVPLVVNTQGWIKGLGADLLSKLKTDSEPTHVCSFVSAFDGDDSAGHSDGGSHLQPQQRHVYDAAPCADENLPYRLLALPPAPPNPLESKWTASDYRTLSFVSYFYSNLAAAAPVRSSTSSPTSVLSSVWQFTSPLIARPPYALDWRRQAGQISAVHLAEGHDVLYEHVLHALNGSFVAIVESTSSTGDSPSVSTSFPFDPSSTPPNPANSRALGLGLVRSIDPSTSTLHLLTPVPPPPSSISLVKASLDVPLALMLDHTASDVDRERGLMGVSWKDVPFLSIEEGEGAGRRRVRRNLMRRAHG